jgi:hypothetical protein
MEFILGTNEDGAGIFPMPAMGAARLAFYCEDLPMSSGNKSGELKQKGKDDYGFTESPPTSSRQIKKQRTELAFNSSTAKDSLLSPVLPSQAGRSSFGEMDVLSGKNKPIPMRYNKLFYWVMIHTH